MAFFKFRKSGEEQPAPAAQPETMEALRRRAKNRLIGAVILVLVGVIGFPLLVDKEPRPVAVDLPITIPSRDQLAPLALPSSGAASQAAQGAPERAADAPAAASAAPVARSAPTESAQKDVSAADAQGGSASAAQDRYVVQVGSFSDANRAKVARGKLERAGLRHYTQVIDTKEGKRIRVRAGPFDSKAEADRAAAKIRKLDMSADVLSL